MTTGGHRLEFGPPPTQGRSRALVLAVVAHLVLLAILTLGVQWRRTASTTPVEAELWSAIPKAAAPRLVEPPPASPPPPPPAPPPVVKPPPVVAAPDADIALKQEKERLEKEKLLAAQQHAEELRKKEKLAAEKKREQERQVALEKKREQELHEAELREKEQKDKLAADKKLEQEKLAAEKKREQEKLVAEKKREQERLQAIKSKEEQARLENQRKLNLQRMAGLAGASGAPGATGTAQKASGPSSSYGGRVSAIVKPNIVFTETTSDNPTALVEVRAAPDGTIVGRKLVKSSGNTSWDEAVLKAIDKTEVLPRDIDGTVPPLLEINFRRHD